MICRVSNTRDSLLRRKEERVRPCISMQFSAQNNVQTKKYGITGEDMYGAGVGMGTT